MFLTVFSFVIILKDVGWNARHLLQDMSVTDAKYLVCWLLVNSWDNYVIHVIFSVDRVLQVISFNIAQQMVMSDLM